MSYIVEVPKDFLPYVTLLVEKGFAESDADAVYELMDARLRLLVEYQAGDGIGDPEVMEEILGHLRGCESAGYFIPWDFVDRDKIPEIAKTLSISPNLTLSLMVYTGLFFQGYCLLRHEVPEYETDDAYRAMVDAMPHYYYCEDLQNLTVPAGAQGAASA